MSAALKPLPPEQEDQGDSWRTALLDFFTTDWPTNFSRGGVIIRNSVLMTRGARMAVFNRDKKIVVFRACPLAGDIFGYILKKFEDYSIGRGAYGNHEPPNPRGQHKDCWEIEAWARLDLHNIMKNIHFVPVLSFPHNPLNVEFLHESIDHGLVRLVSKKTRLGERARSWWKLRETLANYHRYHGLDFEEEPLEAQLDRLKLGPRYAKMLVAVITE